MTWVTVTRKDFRDAVRARSLWALSVLFVLATGAVAYGYPEFTTGPGQETVAAGNFILFAQGIASTFITITGLLVGHKAIAGERESGSIKVMLGLPHTRRDMLLGKVLGRGLVLAVPLLLGLVAGALVIVALPAYTGFSVVDYGLFSALTLLFGFAFVAIAVGLSSVTASSSRAAAAAIGFWFLDQIWGVLVLGVLFVVNGLSLPSPPYPGWFHALSGLGPSAAYSNAVRFLLPADVVQIIEESLGGLPEWYGIAMLSVWVLVPVGLAYWRFEGLDL